MSSIDIIIPIKGSPELLHDRSLPSLLAQNLQTFKVTIVDDGSTQREFQQVEGIVEGYRQKGMHINVLQNQGASGAAGARNFGFKATSGDYVLWFDSDDVLLNNKLELSMNLIESGPYDVAITRAQHMVDSALTDEFWGEPVAPNRGAYKFHFPYQTMCALYRRSFLELREIKWHEDIEMMNDWLFSNEIILKTNNWVFSPDVTAQYFVPTSASESIGSTLTKKKIHSQQMALLRIQSLIQDQNLKLDLISKIKLARLSVELKRQELFRNLFG